MSTDVDVVGVVVATEEEEEYTSAALNARELEWAINSPELLALHKQHNTVVNTDGTTTTVIRTRFPPEPNGYLHIGHAKSMNMNFRLAFDKLGVPIEKRRTIFRYDDTNPDAESAEYIDSLARDLQWLGWTPERTTYSCDNFSALYEFAVILVRKGLAYVCDMTKAEMEMQRELAMKRANARATGKDPNVMAPIPSPDILPGRNRDTSVERNLELFEKMKMGFFDEGTYTLRLKMDFESANPNMYDLVAYRIKYTAHPHLASKTTGSGAETWCIYPSYDFTHGICDSLEHIDYSICTLEFETRREPYYWILWALDLFRPKVYEMSRLNLQYTVLSKRRLIKLVDAGLVRAWSDPRMPTISGLRRRGYTAAIINQFCQDVGATRSMNLVEASKLYQTARLQLAQTSRRCMACLEPIKVVINNFHEEIIKLGTCTFEVQNSPTDPSLGSHTISFTDTIYINSTDFRLVDSPEYYGLAPNKIAGVKYVGGNLICDKYLEGEGQKITELHCRLDLSEDRPKPKTHISWVPGDALQCEVRLYDHLFTVPEPSALWEDELNPNSEIVYPNALIDPSVREVVDFRQVSPWESNTALQFERLGYFVVDTDTTFDPTTGTGKLVFNRTVSLKEDIAVQKLSAVEEAAIAKRRELSKTAAAAKEGRMQIDPINFFKEAEEYVGKYSKYDESTGMPTHDAEGIELTKSAIKKLAKDKEKHMKKVMTWRKQQEQGANN